MSEPIAGVIAPPREVRVGAAAAMILLRSSGPWREVFWVRRGPLVSFSGGYHAFPGGRVDADDAKTPILRCPDGEREFRVCALRETFEETGLLLAPGAERLGADELGRLRAELLAGRSFRDLLAAVGLELDGALLIPAGRWLTPGSSAIRFDARFYLARVAWDVEASVIPGELSDGGWIKPADAIAAWEAGQVLMHPPNQHAMSVLAGFTPEQAIWHLRNPPFQDATHVVERIEFQRGILVFPLLTPTLPPATHTNCFVLGTGELAIVDPGAPDAGEQARLGGFLGQLVAEGRRVKCVLLTHHHPDHTGAAVAIAARFGVPVRATPIVAERVAGVVGDLADGDVIALDGPLPMRFRCVLTEGHARGHLVFYDEASRAVIAGDMVAGGSTIVIDPPEGDLAIYMESLRRMRELPAGTLYPAHGYVIRDGRGKLDEYLAHREARVQQIRTALGSGGTTVADLVRTVYSATPEYLHPVAERSALASLIELERRGEARRQEAERWVRV